MGSFTLLRHLCVQLRTHMVFSCSYRPLGSSFFKWLLILPKPEASSDSLKVDLLSMLPPSSPQLSRSWILQPGRLEWQPLSASFSSSGSNGGTPLGFAIWHQSTAWPRVGFLPFPSSSPDPTAPFQSKQLRGQGREKRTESEDPGGPAHSGQPAPFPTAAAHLKTGLFPGSLWRWGVKAGSTWGEGRCFSTDKSDSISDSHRRPECPSHQAGRAAQIWH